MLMAGVALTKPTSRAAKLRSSICSFLPKAENGRERPRRRSSAAGLSLIHIYPADIPILICGFAFGPAAGFIVTLIAAFIQGFTVSAQSGIYGIIMHIVATGAYVLSSSLFYRKHKTKKMAAVAIGIGTLTMVVCMFFANLVITPYFLMGAVNSGTVSAVLSLMPFILLFNLIKAVANGAITFFIYKLSLIHI